MGSFFIVLSAPTKLDPLSEYIRAGHPRLPANRENAPKNDSVDRLLVVYKCVALVEKHTKTQTYPLVIRQLRPVKLLTLKGPAKQTPVFEKCLVSIVRSGGVTP